MQSQTQKGLSERRQGLWVMLLVLSLIVVACGSDGSSDDGAATTTESDSPATTTPGDTETTTPETDATSTTVAAGSLDALYEAAQAEGEMLFWGGENADDMQQFFSLFSETYPGITVEHLEIPPEDVIQQFLTLDAAGQDPPPDLFNSNLNFMTEIIEQDMVQTDTDWQAYGVPDEAVDPAGGIISQIGVYGLAYNTDVMNPDDLPTTWEDLINPDYEGALTLDGRGNPWELFSPIWSAEEAVDYVERLISEVNPVVVTGGTAGLTHLINGEAGLRPAFKHDVDYWIDQGAPIDFQWLDIGPAKGTYWYLTTTAQHPNAAKLFAIWFSQSQEASDLQYELAFRTPQMPQDIPSEVEVVEAKTAEDFEVATAITEQVTEMLAGLEQEGES